jgi:HPt (histidine-containing phosphotransfer) domain-containing protein
MNPQSPIHPKAVFRPDIESDQPATNKLLCPFDLDQLLNRCLGDTEFAGVLLGKFAARLSSDFQQLSDAIRAGLPAAIASAAHGLRGGALAVSANSLARMTFDIEQLPGGSTQIDHMQQLDEIKAEVARCFEAIPTARDYFASCMPAASDPSFPQEK